MELNKFTNKSKEIINSSQVLAMMNNHQMLKPIHLLKPLSEEDDFRDKLKNSGVDYSKLHSANFEILIEIDCGEGRSGLAFQDEKIREIFLARKYS